MLFNCLAVGLGGFAGSVCRYLLGLIPVKTGGFPFTTLLINILGAFVLSLVVSLASRSGMLSARSVLFLKVGLCGGFTTFSTFAYESFSLLGSGHSLSAVCYIALSITLSLLAVWAGQAVSL